MPMHFDCWEIEPQAMTLDQYRAGLARDAVLADEEPVRQRVVRSRAKREHRAR